MGEFFWNALLVEVLWVDEQYRNNGLGTKLLMRAEGLARERSCDLVYLSTFLFQAPSFYAKNGYAVIGELAGLPRGAARRWYAKRLAKDAIP